MTLNPDNPWGVDFEDSQRHIGESSWDFDDNAEVDLATLMLFQPKMRDEDMFELVADKYISRYVEASAGKESPVKKDVIMRIRNRRLQPLPIIRKRK